MRTEHQETINGRSYECVLMGASEGALVFAKLVKNVGSAWAAMMDSISAASVSAGGKPLTVGELAKVDVKIRPIMDALADRMEPEEFVALVKKLLAGVRCDGAPINFEVHFAGKIKEMLDVAFFVAKENFPDFFDRAGPASSGAASPAP